MRCLDALRLAPGITAVIGSGGKTSLLRAAGEALRGRGAAVALSTTTHMRAFAGMPLVTGADAAEGLRRGGGIACFGTPVEGSAGAGALPKLGPGALGPGELAAFAEYVLVEADGSRGLPLKAHRADEPAAPGGAGETILLVGASGFGRPIAEAVHRPELFCALVGCTAREAATPELVARAIIEEMRRGSIAPTQVIVNQVDTEGDEAGARRLAAGRFAAALRHEGVGLPLWCGSIRADDIRPL